MKSDEDIIIICDGEVRQGMSTLALEMKKFVEAQDDTG